MNNKARTLILPASLMVVMALLVATSARAGDKVVYRLKWLRNVSVVGALYAETHGLFEKAGLDVEVKAGGPEGMRSGNWNSATPISARPPPTRCCGRGPRGRRWW